MEFNTFYSSYPNLRAKFEKKGRAARFMGQTKEELLDWQSKTRELLEKRLGLDLLDHCPLQPEKVEDIMVKPQIRREKVLLQTEWGVTLSVFILIPDSANQNTPCFLAPCGHLGGGKYSVAGALEIPGMQEKINQFQYDYGMKLATLGYVAICPDARGFGEMREGFTSLADLKQDENQKIFYECSCYQLSHMATALGQTLLGMQVHDLMSLIDYVIERGEWDTKNLGCIGFSGGGMQTLYLSALDTRIKKVMISGYFYGFGDSLLIRNGNCNCNYVPGLLKDLDCGDIGCLLAPRPVVIQSCREDHLNGPRGLSNVIEQLEIMEKCYQLLDRKEAVIRDVCEGPHSFHQENMEILLQKLEKYTEKRIEGYEKKTGRSKRSKSNGTSDRL